jgi:hypothetical protein
MRYASSCVPISFRKRAWAQASHLLDSPSRTIAPQESAEPLFDSLRLSPAVDREAACLASWKKSDHTRPFARTVKVALFCKAFRKSRVGNDAWQAPARQKKCQPTAVMRRIYVGALWDPLPASGSGNQLSRVYGLRSVF